MQYRPAFLLIPDSRFQSRIIVHFRVGFVHSAIILEATTSYPPRWFCFVFSSWVIMTNWHPVASVPNVKLVFLRYLWLSNPWRHQNWRETWNQTFPKRDRGLVREKTPLFWVRKVFLIDWWLMDGVLHVLFLQLFYFCVEHLVGEHEPGFFCKLYPQIDWRCV